MKTINKMVKFELPKYSSPTSLAHKALYEKQEKKKSWLNRNDLELTLQTTPGIIFPQGTTFDEIIQKLESHNYIRSDETNKGELRYFVLSNKWY